MQDIKELASTKHRLDQPPGSFILYPHSLKLAVNQTLNEMTSERVNCYFLFAPLTALKSERSTSIWSASLKIESQAPFQNLSTLTGVGDKKGKVPTIMLGSCHVLFPYNIVVFMYYVLLKLRSWRAGQHYCSRPSLLYTATILWETATAPISD